MVNGYQRPKPGWLSFVLLSLGDSDMQATWGLLPTWPSIANESAHFSSTFADPGLSVSPFEGSKIKKFKLLPTVISILYCHTLKVSVAS